MIHSCRPGHSVCTALAVVLRIALGADADVVAEAAVPDRVPSVTEETIQDLIQQLGAEDFARREKAEAELRRLGLAAFDALHKAQVHDDLEIALRARYLLRSMSIRWFHEDDPPEVKEILRGYDDKSAGERRSLMDLLSKLGDGQGVAALCRLARFETSHTLSKRAALLVLQQTGLWDLPNRPRLTRMIQREVGFSQRDASDWLRAYVNTLEKPEADLPLWERFVRQEEKVFQDTPERSGADIVRDLLRWQAELLERAKRPTEARAIVSRTIDLMDGSVDQLAEMVNWLMQRQDWATVEEVAKRFSQRFHENLLLEYSLAEAQRQQGRKEEAEGTARRAMQMVADNLQEHILAAIHLQERGLFDWAEREFRHVIDVGPAGGQYEIRSRFLLSEMLHDQQQELAAAKALQGVVDVIEKDQNALHLVARINRDPGSVRSRMHYFYAEHYRGAGDTAKQIAELRLGIEQDPTDADVLIAMHRAPPPDDNWRKETRTLIDRAAQQFRDQAQECQQQADEAPTEEVRSVYQRQLATALNQLAWLVGNTEGDLDEALRASHRSLELAPETSGYLDTLGRCYFARGDCEKAVKYQSRAVDLDPHSGQIRRQLDFFKQALQTAKAPQK